MRHTPYLYARALERLGRVEAALKMQQEFADQLLAAIQAAVVVLDEHGDIVYINPFMERLSGYRLAEVMERNWCAAFLPGRDRQPIRVLFPKAIGGIRTQANLGAIVTKSGEERLIRWSEHLLPAWAGNQHWLLVSGIDVTDRERAASRHIPGQESDPETEIRQGLEDIIGAICGAVEARNPYAAGYPQRMAELALAIGRRMGMDEYALHGLHMGAVIHDIGMLQVPAGILTKPAGLDADERAQVKRHPGAGHAILKDIRLPWPVAEIVYQHHERLDGSGYPQGLKGEQICLEARIVAVADVVAAMSARRAYRDGMGIEAALAELSAHKGVRYDAGAVDACLGAFADGFSFH